MSKFRYIDDLLAESKQRCAHSGCMKAGEHRAPISALRPNEYQHLCLEHVTLFNKQWDFFKEKSSEEIIAFQKEAVTGHRPTWRMHTDPKLTGEKLQAALHRFMSGNPMPKEMYAPPLNKQDRRALEQLDLEHPSNEQTIKKQYKKLARRFHPDRNNGDKTAEERFKEINVAYRHLIQNYCAAIRAA